MILRNAFIKNPSFDKNIGVQIVSEDLQVRDIGPEGAVLIDPDLGRTAICLAPDKVLSVADNNPSESEPIELTGNFAIEINGVMVPFAFSAEQLGEAFSQVPNPDFANYGIAFVEVPST